MDLRPFAEPVPSGGTDGTAMVIATPMIHAKALVTVAELDKLRVAFGLHTPAPGGTISRHHCRQHRTTPYTGTSIWKAADVTNGLKQQIAIPAYFKPDTMDAAANADWLGTDSKAGAASAGALLKIVVFNPASGPGYTLPFRSGGAVHADFQTRIEQMREVGANVLGYVTTNRRDSRPGDTVQREHRFTVDPATGVVTTRNSDGDVHETGWTKGFGPIQVRSEGTLPGGLAIETDYFWIPVSPQTGKFARTKANAIAEPSVAIDHFTSAGDPPDNNKIHGMGLSRTLKNIENVKFEIDEYYARWPDIDGMFFDEMNDVGDADDKEYYKVIFDHVKTKAGNALVVQNPGRKFPELEEMFDIADTFITFEGTSVSYAGHVPDPWMMPKPAQKFWHVIHSCPPDRMPEMIERSRTNNAGHVYVTNFAENIYKHIATNFADEITKVKSENAGG